MNASWQNRFRRWFQAHRLAPAAAGAPPAVHVSGAPELLPATLARVLVGTPGRLLIITTEPHAAERAAEALEAFGQILNESRPLLLLPPAGDPRRRQWIPENEAARAFTLDAAARGLPAVFLAAAGAVLAPLPHPEHFEAQALDLGPGDAGWDPEKLAAALTAMDYDNEVEVHIPGEFARRGGILDVFSPLHPDPVRIEFFGSTIESMRFFRADTQRSIGPAQRIRIVPRGESLTGAGGGGVVAGCGLRVAGSGKGKGRGAGGKTACAEEMSGTVTFLDYLGADAPVVLVDPDGIIRHLETFAAADAPALWQAALAPARPRLDILSGESQPVVNEIGNLKLEIGGDPQTVARNSAESEPSAKFQISNFNSPPPNPQPASLNPEPISVLDLLGAHLSELGRGTESWGWDQTRLRLVEWHRQNFDLVAFCATAGDAERLRQLLAESPETRDISVATHTAMLDAGFLLSDERLLILSERELFGRRAPARPVKASPYRLEAMLRDNFELDEGSYAVHAANGICIYHGIKEIETGGRMHEALELEFAGDARLFVPLEQVQLVSRYVGGSKKLPALSRLGGVAWKHARADAEEAAVDLAAELLRIAAVREHAPGSACRADNAWEKLFSASFPYTETPDQAKAIQETLEDMAQPKPMDRLICGDVGYGKTEVAVRAAFRAVLNGRQAAVLVPTTILAQQHYRTFRDRMAEYPVRIGMLSRFRTKAEQRALLDEARTGRVDIIIGTHRLLQGDVRFANLGLVVIDEEQRFGVEHKERLKALRAEVDVLTMTATPIPRTLYFSLAGLRNLSTIMSPPVDRLPITTIVCAVDDAIIREAILRELDRKGQVFFLHNRVQTIVRFAAHLKLVVPEANFAIAHGQMPPDELEEVMSKFVDGGIDVLICTTIIESGLDIPNANTILIDHAERFGLAELYQLRGRVGRYHHQAYAYFLLPPHGCLPENARQRLAAIRRYHQLGAGFKLALRDLEIRGAGNLLGAAQSGHIAAIGFDLYCQLLKEAVAKMEHQPPARKSEIPVVIEGVVVALHDQLGRQTAAIPPDYVGAEIVRLELYRRIREAKTPAEFDALEAELADRFGPPPPPIQALLGLGRIRALAVAKGFHAVTVRGGEILLETTHGLVRKSGRLPRLFTEAPLARLRELRKILEELKPGG